MKIATLAILIFSFFCLPFVEAESEVHVVFKVIDSEEGSIKVVPQLSLVNQLGGPALTKSSIAIVDGDGNEMISLKWEVLKDGEEIRLVEESLKNLDYQLENDSSFVLKKVALKNEKVVYSFVKGNAVPKD